MAEPELLLDSNIRLWVVLPIVFITFLVGVIRHYVSILLQSDKKLTLEQVSDRCVITYTSKKNHKRRKKNHAVDLRLLLQIQPGSYSEQNPQRKWKIHSQTGKSLKMCKKKKKVAKLSENCNMLVFACICHDCSDDFCVFQSFLMRKFYFNNQEDGFFKKTKRKVVPPSPMTGEPL